MLRNTYGFARLTLLHTLHIESLIYLVRKVLSQWYLVAASVVENPAYFGATDMTSRPGYLMTQTDGHFWVTW